MTNTIKVLGHIDINTIDNATTKKNYNKDRLTKDQLPKDCWVLEDKRYRYNDKTFCYLPYAFADNKPVLDMLGVNYYEDTLGDKHILSFENPDYPTEFETHSAPIYYKEPTGGYVATKKMHTGVIFTEDTVRALAEIRQKVTDAIKEYTIFCKAQEVLNSHMTGIMLSKHKSRTTIDLAGNSVQAYSLRVGEEDYLTVFFDLKKIEALSNEIPGENKLNIILDLPENLGMYYSKISSNAGLWAAEMGLGYIYIREMAKSPWYKR